MANAKLLMPVVAAALRRADGRVLLHQRPEGKQHAGLWEFPGGKVETGETPEAALARELGEELGVAVDPADAVPLGFASVPAGARHLLLLLYTVDRWSGEPAALEGGAIAWVLPADMAVLPMPPADRPLAWALASAVSTATG